MALTVSCQCGASFGAPEKLAGKKARCPKCGSVIAIPLQDTSGNERTKSPSPEKSSRRGSSGASGGAKRVVKKEASRQTQQSNQTKPKRRSASQPQDLFEVENLGALDQKHDPLGVESISSPPAPAPQAVVPKRPADAKKGAGNKTLLWVVLGLGVACFLLIGFIGIGAVVMLSKGGKDQDQVAEASADEDTGYQPQQRPNPYGSGRSASSLLPANTVESRGNQVDPAGQGNETFSGTGAGDSNQANGFGSDPVDSDTSGGFGSDPEPPTKVEEEPPTKQQKLAGARLVDATLDWHSRPGDELFGAREVEDEELVILHYSWLTELLPGLGYQEVYDQIDFETAYVYGENQLVAMQVIPEFLNPADDRKTSTDIRFESFGLTHFAGMSGIEERPNDLAAEFPRSDPRAGVFGYHEVARPEQITDGTSNTIMLIGTGRIVQPWITGGGATIRGARDPYFGKNNGFGSKGLAKEGAVVVMADGSVRVLGSDIDSRVFRAMCTIQGSENVDLESSSDGELPAGWFAE